MTIVEKITIVEKNQCTVYIYVSSAYCALTKWQSYDSELLTNSG